MPRRPIGHDRALSDATACAVSGRWRVRQPFAHLHWTSANSSEIFVSCLPELSLGPQELSSILCNALLESQGPMSTGARHTTPRPQHSSSPISQCGSSLDGLAGFGIGRLEDRAMVAWLAIYGSAVPAR